MECIHLWFDDELISLLSLGKTYKEVSKKLGIKEGTVISRFKTLKKNGVEVGNKRRVHRSKKIKPPVDKTIEIEDPPMKIPVPDGATFQPWIDLKKDQCQWSMGDFWDDPSNVFECCGLKTENRKRFCDYHLAFAKKGWNDE